VALGARGKAAAVGLSALPFIALMFAALETAIVFSADQIMQTIAAHAG
jgi:Flp pilus assembly protein TadG